MNVINTPDDSPLIFFFCGISLKTSFLAWVTQNPLLQPTLSNQKFLFRHSHYEWSHVRTIFQNFQIPRRAPASRRSMSVDTQTTKMKYVSISCGTDTTTQIDSNPLTYYACPTVINSNTRSIDGIRSRSMGQIQAETCHIFNTALLRPASG